MQLYYRILYLPTFTVLCPSYRLYAVRSPTGRLERPPLCVVATPCTRRLLANFISATTTDILISSIPVHVFRYVVYLTVYLLFFLLSHLSLLPLLFHLRWVTDPSTYLHKLYSRVPTVHFDAPDDTTHERYEDSPIRRYSTRYALRYFWLSG